MTTRACSKCNKEKEHSFFSYRNKDEGVRHARCKECVKISTSKHYKENKSRYLTKASLWAEGNKDKRSSIVRNSYAKIKGYTLTSIAEKYKVSDTAISHIKSKSTWRHVK